MKPFESIPDYPAAYSPASMVVRMIDGLGYRYHWASRDLTETDLNYSPGNDGQTCIETLKHIHVLSRTILTVCRGEKIDGSIAHPEYEFPQLRDITLQNLEEARSLLLTVEDVATLHVTFKRNDRESAFPFWNLINGHITDAIYHTGQIVSFRRSSGNPLNPKVNVFTGKNRD